MILRTAWGRWRCSDCGSLLGIDTKRRFLAITPWFVLVIVLVALLRVTRMGPFFAIPIIALPGLLAVFLMDRPLVLERCGFRCRKCGYDLQGQVEPMCPECGTDLSDAEIAILERVRAGTTSAADVRGERRRLGWGSIVAIVLVVVAVTALLVTGIIIQQQRRNPAPAGQTTQAPAD